MKTRLVTDLRLARSCPPERRGPVLPAPGTPMVFSRPHRIYTSLESAAAPGGHESLALVSGGEGGAAGSMGAARSGAPRASEKARAPARTRTGLWKRPSDPRVHVCATSLFFFFPDFLLNILLPRTANFWQNARDSADQMVWAVAHPPQPARLVGDLASRVLSPAVLATQLGNKLNFSM